MVEIGLVPFESHEDSNICLEVQVNVRRVLERCGGLFDVACCACADGARSAKVSDGAPAHGDYGEIQADAAQRNDGRRRSPPDVSFS